MSPFLSPLVLDSKAIDSNQPMNALMRLNQIRPGLQYRLLSQSGPVHAPVFTMSVDLDGTIYEASGSSKKTAKLHVAVKVRQTKENVVSELCLLIVSGELSKSQQRGDLCASINMFLSLDVCLCE